MHNKVCGCLQPVYSNHILASSMWDQLQMTKLFTFWQASSKHEVLFERGEGLFTHSPLHTSNQILMCKETLTLLIPVFPIIFQTKGLKHLLVHYQTFKKPSNFLKSPTQSQLGAMHLNLNIESRGIVSSFFLGIAWHVGSTSEISESWQTIGSQKPIPSGYRGLLPL